jgi:hypothetical protein
MGAALAVSDPRPPQAPYVALILDGRGTSLLDGMVAYDTSVSGYHSNEMVGLITDWFDEDRAFRVEVTPPAGQAWQVGVTYPVSADLPTSTVGQLKASRGTRICGRGGTVTVHDVQREAGEIRAFAASFAVGCPFAPASLTGEMRWYSDVGYVAAVTDVKRLSFGHQTPGVTGKSQTVTVTGSGTTPLTLGTAVVDGADASAFQVSADTCSGTQLSYGQTCAVTVTATAAAGNAQAAELSIPDNTAAGDLRVGLNVNAVTDSASNRGTFYPVTPHRIVDTRGNYGSRYDRLGADQTIDIQVVGRGGVPAVGVLAVVLNVTVTGGTSGSFLTVYPAGVDRPLASSLNTVAGWTGANSVTVGVGAGGKVSVYNHLGSTALIVDVSGFYAADDSMVAEYGEGGGYRPLVPKRLYDSRINGGARVPSQQSVWIPIPAEPAMPYGIRAAVVNVTAVGAANAGYLTAWSGAHDLGGESLLPYASTVNYRAGETVPNLAVVPIFYGANGPGIAVFTSTDAHVVVDLFGVFDYQRLPDGLRFAPRTPTRIVDTRGGLGVAGPLGVDSTAAVTLPNTVVPAGTRGLALNVTAVAPSADTYVAVWPAGVSRPTVSNLNPARATTIPNAVYTLLGPANGFQLYNNTGHTDVVVDVVGSFAPPS